MLKRIKVSHKQGEPIPPNFLLDHEWIHASREQLIADYGECWVVVYQGRVIGSADDYHDALEDAEMKLSPEFGVITPVCEWTGRYNPFSRIRFIPPTRSGVDT